MKRLLSFVIAIEVSDHGMPNDVNWCEYNVSEGDATRTSKVQMEDGSYAQTAGTRKRIA